MSGGGVRPAGGAPRGGRLAAVTVMPFALYDTEEEEARFFSSYSALQGSLSPISATNLYARY